MNALASCVIADERFAERTTQVGGYRRLPDARIISHDSKDLLHLLFTATLGYDYDGYIALERQDLVV